MLSAERREEMRRIVIEQKMIRVTDMAERFNVSSETIRRDFDVLSKEGMVIKSYGGAMLNTRVTVYTTLQSRKELFSDEKKRIAKKAAEFIKPNECIFLDHSSTVYAICDEIHNMPLVVVTNSLQVLNRFSLSEKIKVIATGGTLMCDEQAFVGVHALEYIKRHCVDKAFVSCTKLNKQYGASDSDEQIAELRRAVVKNSCDSFLLLDHTKVDGSAFVSAYDLNEVNTVISNVVWDNEWKEYFLEKSVQGLSC